MALAGHLVVAACLLFGAAAAEWDAPRAIPLAFLALFAAVGAIGSASMEGRK